MRYHFKEPGFLRKGFFLCFFCLLFAASAVSAPSGGSAVPESARDKSRQLVFAGDAEYFPYSYMYNGSPAGYSVDLMKILSLTVYSFISKDVTIRLLPWDQCLSELRAGTVDGIIGFPAYGKREPGIAYTRPVAEIDFAIFVKTGNSYVSSLQSLEGTVVGVYEKSPIIDELSQDHRIKLLKTPTVLEALRKLKNNEVTAVIAQKAMAVHYIQHAGLTDLKIVGPPVGPVYGYFLAVRNDDPKLLDDLNLGIETLEENGTMNKLRQKWFGLNLTETFPWKMVSLVIGGITGILVMLMASLWVISLNATLRIKTHQIHVMSRKIVEKDKLAVLGKLAGQIAHELRTPLSVIHNTAYLLRKEGARDEALFEKRIKMLEDKIKLASNILESILSYSRVKAEVATTVSVKKCIEETLKDMEIPEGIEKDISFENEDSLFAFMDFHQLYSVFRNLLLNAVQAMGDTGKLTIKVSLSENDNMVTAHIQDTGRGIPEDARNKIFNLFFSSKFTGTGLGLPISKSIIEANGGHIYLDRTGKTGSCFVVKLPHSRTHAK
ncbi:MAG: transporter substrate-binding domain-containing protein [Candidatus Omnitrophota bacterium]